MKVLNLEKLSKKEGRELVIGGVSYPVQPMTVANFIATTEAAEKLKGESSLAKQVSATIDMIQRSVPTAQREVLEQLELGQLQAITAFIRGEEVEGAESSAPAEAGQEGEAKN